MPQCSPQVDGSHCGPILTPRSRQRILNCMWVSFPISVPGPSQETAPPDQAHVTCSHFTHHSAGVSLKPRALAPWQEQEPESPEHVDRLLSMWLVGRLVAGGWRRQGNGAQPHKTIWGGKDGRIQPVLLPNTAPGDTKRALAEGNLSLLWKVLARKGWREGPSGDWVQLLEPSEHLLSANAEGSPAHETPQ